MDEDVLPPGIRCYETISLGRVEPFNGAHWHRRAAFLPEGGPACQARLSRTLARIIPPECPLGRFPPFLSGRLAHRYGTIRVNPRGCNAVTRRGWDGPPPWGNDAPARSDLRLLRRGTSL